MKTALLNRIKALSIRLCAFALLMGLTIFINSCKKDETPAPALALSGFSPASGSDGTLVTISGDGFSTTANNNTVKFNGTQATVNTASATELKVVVPAGASTGKITITVDGRTATSATDFIVALPPSITSFAPASGVTGNSVTVIGTNFDAMPANNSVKINNVTAVVTAASATSLTITVPTAATTGKITVEVGGAIATSAADFVVIPVITDFSPLLGATGSTIHITGSGFKVGTVVKIDGIVAATSEITANSISAVVPPGTTSGLVTVIVDDHNATSSAPFEVIIEVVQAGGNDFDFGKAVTVDASGNVYVTGSFRGTAVFGNTTLTSAGSDDIFIAKYNSSHGLVWVRQAGGPDSDFGWGIAVDNSGNTYVTGSFSSASAFEGTFLTAAGSADIFVARYNSMGNLDWAKQAGGNDGHFEQGRSLKVDAAGEVIVTGAFSGAATFGSESLTSTGGTDIFVARYDHSNGDVLWVKNSGGTDDDDAISLALDGSDNIFVTGTFFGTAVFGATSLTAGGGIDAFVAKFDPNGDALWAKQVKGTDFDAGYSVAVDGAGDCYIAGYFTSSAIFDATTTVNGAGNEDIFVAKYSSAAGDLIWARSGGGNDYDQAKSIAVDGSGNCYVTGYFTRMATFGTTTVTSVNQSRDIFVLSVSPNGTISMLKNTGAENDDYGESIAVSDGILYVTGSFQQTATFGTTTLTSEGQDDVYVWKIRL